jgi:hypothetical protein
LGALEKSIPLIKCQGWEEGSVFEVGSPYISAARANMTRKALDADADVIVYLDDDLSWKSIDILTLLQTEGDVVAGVYRFKDDEEKYMGALVTDDNNFPIVREDGCIKAEAVPAGFLKITAKGIEKFMGEYPELMYGCKYKPSIDLFNHGAHEGVWYGEDYSFSRRWREKCGDLWILPDLDITHHSKEKEYPGNFHKFLLKQPGGSNAEVSEKREARDDARIRRAG